MNGKILSYAYQASSKPIIPKPWLRDQLMNFNAEFSLINRVIPVFPSSGGTGSRLKVPRRRFSRKMMLRKVAANP